MPLPPFKVGLLLIGCQEYEYEILYIITWFKFFSFFFSVYNISHVCLSLGSTEDKRNAVIKAFLHAWKGYQNYAWGHDHLKPITKSYQNWFGLGLTIVDSLDTMFMMGLKEGIFLYFSISCICYNAKLIEIIQWYLVWLLFIHLLWIALCVYCIVNFPFLRIQWS